MSRRKEPAIPFDLLDQLLAGGPISGGCIEPDATIDDVPKRAAQPKVAAVRARQSRNQICAGSRSVVLDQNMAISSGAAGKGGVCRSIAYICRKASARRR